MVLFGAAALARFSGSVRAEAERGAVAASASVRTLVDQQAGRLSTLAESWASSRSVIEQVGASDGQGLATDVADVLVARGTADAVAIVTADRVLASAGEPEDLDSLVAAARATLGPDMDPAIELGPELVTLPSGIHLVSIRAIPGADGGGTPGAVLAVSRRLDAGLAIEAAQLTGFSVAFYLVDGRLSAASDQDVTLAVGPPALRPPGSSPDTEVRDANGYASAFSELTARDGVSVGYAVTSAPLEVLNEIDDQLGPVLVLGFLFSAIGAVLLALLVSIRLRRQVAVISGGMAAVAEGDTSVRFDAIGGDAMANLAVSHNRLAATLERRETRLKRAFGEVEGFTPDRGVRDLAAAGAQAAVDVFDLSSAQLEDSTGRVVARAEARPPADTDGPDAGGPAGPAGWTVPGSTPGVEVAVNVPASAGSWLLVGRTGPGRDWSEADTTLLSLYGRQLGAAIRDAELYAVADERAAEMERLGRLQNDFLRGVSHNLRTPLTRIGVVAEDLRATHRDDPAVVRDTLLIGAEGERLSYLLAQLLALTRIDAAALAVTAEPVSIPRIVRRVAPIATDRAVTLVDEAPGLVPIADPVAVEQVLWMLLDNAAKYGGEGEIRVRISPCSEGTCLPGAVADACVAIGVEDDGPGVPGPERTRIFERFVRGSTVGDQAGTGLGLDVARSLVEAMGGTIRCEDAPGGGARFVVTLPAEEAAPPA